MQRHRARLKEWSRPGEEQKLIDPDAHSTIQRSQSPRGWRLGLLGLLVVAAIGLGWTLVSRAASIRMYVIPSTSMGPTILPGDRVTVDMSRTTLPRRGEIWLFAMPSTGLGQPTEAIKRVIGLPNETIAVAGGKVFIDGQPLPEPYLAAPITYTMAPLTLGPAEYFMLGDSRNTSADSHVWGPLPHDRLRGRALYRVWPLSRTRSF